MKRTKEPKKPTRSQKIAMTEAGLNCRSWLVEKDEDGTLNIVSRKSGQRRKIAK